MQRIDYGCEQGPVPGEQLIEVRVREIGRAGDAIAAATGAGANVCPART
jgi:hypothetical protein